MKKKKKDYKENLIFICLLFFSYLFLYLNNLSSYVYGGDSAEFSTVLKVFGIAHPPGYPLYSLLGNIFVRIIPFFNYYQRVSFYTSLFTFLGVIIIFLTLKRLTNNFLISIYSSLFFLILFPVWLYSLVPEVFSLAIILISLQIFSLLTLYKKKNLNDKSSKFFKYLFFISLGLSIVHHHLFLFFIPSYYFLIKKKSILKTFFLKDLFKSLLSLGIPLTIYLYTPIVSYLNTPVDIENAKTLEGFIKLVTRASYGVFTAYPSSSGNFINRIFDSFSSFIFIIHDFKPLGLIIILLGMAYLYKYKKTIFKFFFITTLSLLFFFFYANFYLNFSLGVATFERFLIFFYINLIYYFAFGLIYGYKLIQKIIRYFSTKKILSQMASIFFIIIVGFLFLSTTYNNLKTLSQLKNLNNFEEFGYDIFKSIPKKAVLILTGDNSFFITQHIQLIKNARPDLILMTRVFLERDYLEKKIKLKNKNIFLPKDKKNFSEFLSKNYNKKNFIYSDSPLSEGLWIPYGLLWKYYPSKKEFKKNEKKIISNNLKLWTEYRIPKLSKYKKNYLYLNNIKQSYLKGIWANLNFLTLAKKPKEANKLATMFYNDFKNDSHFLISYINVKLYDNDCSNSLNIAVKKELKLKLTNPTDYLPLINYFKICRQDPKMEDILYQKYLDLKENENKPLNKI